jgi:DNA-nicking Smr family endonuclease
MTEDGPIEMPISGELDLHTFRPQDLGELVPDYLQACRERGIFEVRVIHGKGIGNVKRSVEAILPRLDFVETFAPASTLYGGLGATIVRLKHPAA